eukprot:GHVT01088112.1.p1 GENE.GHVT01088112.1~~GHVT01088112.1.p1  ORF type:complete len:683 (-),score=56.97 GHVT01088112.1:1882-3930(-)
MRAAICFASRRVGLRHFRRFPLTSLQRAALQETWHASPRCNLRPCAPHGPAADTAPPFLQVTPLPHVREGPDVGCAQAHTHPVPRTRPQPLIRLSQWNMRAPHGVAFISSHGISQSLFTAPSQMHVLVAQDGRCASPILSRNRDPRSWTPPSFSRNFSFQRSGMLLSSTPARLDNVRPSVALGRSPTGILQEEHAEEDLDAVVKAVTRGDRSVYDDEKLRSITKFIGSDYHVRSKLKTLQHIDILTASQVVSLLRLAGEQGHRGSAFWAAVVGRVSSLAAFFSPRHCTAAAAALAAAGRRDRQLFSKIAQRVAQDLCSYSAAQYVSLLTSFSSAGRLGLIGELLEGARRRWPLHLTTLTSEDALSLLEVYVHLKVADIQMLGPLAELFTRRAEILQHTELVQIIKAYATLRCRYMPLVNQILKVFESPAALMQLSLPQLTTLVKSLSTLNSCNNVIVRCLSDSLKLATTAPTAVSRGGESHAEKRVEEHGLYPNAHMSSDLSSASSSLPCSSSSTITKTKHSHAKDSSHHRQAANYFADETIIQASSRIPIINLKENTLAELVLVLEQQQQLRDPQVMLSLLPLLLPEIANVSGCFPDSLRAMVCGFSRLGWHNFAVWRSFGVALSAAAASGLRLPAIAAISRAIQRHLEVALGAFQRNHDSRPAVYQSATILHSSRNEADY